jgi:hypothetical protein
MAASKSIRLTISENVGAKKVKRALLSLWPHSDGSAFVQVRCMDFYTSTHPLAALPGKGDVVVEHRISVHPSPNSSEGVSTIVEHARHKDKSKDTKHYAWTTAFKDRAGFALLFVRLCPQLSSADFQIKKENPGNIDLYTYNPQQFTLVLGLFVGHSSCHFDDVDDPTFQMKQRVFEEFNFVFIWSFCVFPAIHAGLFGSLVLHPYADLGGGTFDSGKTELKCADIYKQARSRVHFEMIDMLLKSPNPFWQREEVKGLISLPIYVRKPAMNEFDKATKSAFKRGAVRRQPG